MTRTIFDKKMFLKEILAGDFWKNAGVTCLSLLVGLLLFEMVPRIIMNYSSTTLNRLFMPMKMNIGEKFHANYDQVLEGVVIDGKKITRGDAYGILVEDGELGYRPKRNATSFNGWWQSNNFGARSRHDISEEIPAGKRRVIIFGESFTNCSRVPQEKSWPYYLNKQIKGTQFLNFGVDGYSMCQSFLRYNKIRKSLDYDASMLVFVPTEDLWRDVNVLRKFMGWENYPLVPRFYLDDDQLKLAKSPYKSYADLRRDNNRKFSKTLRSYLSRYDRFYPKRLFNSPSLLNGLYTFRLFNVALFKYQRKALLKRLMSTGSEAMRVTGGIFQRFDKTAEKNGKQFVMVFLPAKTSIEKYKQDPEFRKKYRKMVSYIADKGVDHIDLMKDFVNIDPDKIDLAFDNGHYGPNTNKIISHLLADHLEELQID